MRTLLLATLLSLVGCAATVRAPSAAPVAQVAPPPVAVEPPPPLVTQGTIARTELLPVLDAGLGRFLQGVATEASLEEGRFVGFRIVLLYPSDPRFAGLDLAPGDVVVRINGESIERPEQAFHVWNGLRVASELMIEYLRGGELRELRFAIVD